MNDILYMYLRLLPGIYTNGIIEYAYPRLFIYVVYSYVNVKWADFE